MTKDIKGYEGIYTISDNGEVVVTKTGMIKKYWINNKGYRCVDLSKNGITKHKLVHRLVAEVFVPNPNNDPIVLHLDNNKQNVNSANLAWGTYSENNAQAIRDKLNTVPRPDNRKDYVIINKNGYLDPFYYHGLENVLKAIGYGSVSVANNLVHRHDKIKQGDYKGCYVERLK